MSYPAWIDEHLPPAGPCGICGGPDKRHRMIDAIVEREAAGDSILFIAEDYDLPVEFVRRIVTERPQP